MLDVMRRDRTDLTTSVVPEFVDVTPHPALVCSHLVSSFQSLLLKLPSAIKMGEKVMLLPDKSKVSVRSKSSKAVSAMVV